MTNNYVEKVSCSAVYFISIQLKCYTGEPEKGSHLPKFIAPRMHHRLERFQFQLKAKRSKHFFIFLVVLAALEVSVNLTL